MVLLWLPPYFSLVSLRDHRRYKKCQKGLRDTNEKYGGNHSKTIEDTRNVRKGSETPMKSMEATTARPRFEVVFTSVIFLGISFFKGIF
jgi:hypothetical protein